jgi:hypothetical protein
MPVPSVSEICQGHAIVALASPHTDEEDRTMKTYKAMVWDKDPKKPGKRVTVTADNLEDAKKKLEEKHGTGNVYNLHNEDDASRPR